MMVDSKIIIKEVTTSMSEPGLAGQAGNDRTEYFFFISTLMRKCIDKLFAGILPEIRCFVRVQGR